MRGASLHVGAVGEDASVAFDHGRVRAGRDQGCPEQDLVRGQDGTVQSASSASMTPTARNPFPPIMTASAVAGTLPRTHSNKRRV